MIIRDFKYISTLDTGSTTYELDLINYFKIPTNQSVEKVGEQLKKYMDVVPITKFKKYYWFKGKLWKVCMPLQDETFDQWSRMETILAEENNIQNINRLLAIYFRPVRWYGKVRKFNLNTQEKIEESLLDLDMNIANGLTLFFSIVGFKYMNNIKVFFLNQTKATTKEVPTNQ